MIKVGLTGNMGSGKSTVAEIFRVLGIPVYHADEEAKKFLGLKEVATELKQQFGEKVFDGNLIDKKKLAGLVFNDQKALEVLNSIIHPRVRKGLADWMTEHHRFPYVIQEAAILFESGFHAYFDRNILVACPENVAVGRVVQRDGVSEQEVRARLRNQWPEIKKRPLANYIIENDGSQLIIPQVLKIHLELSAK